MESHCSRPTGARCVSLRSAPLALAGRDRLVRFSFSAVARESERASERANLKKPVVTVIGVYFDKVDIQIYIECSKNVTHFFHEHNIALSSFRVYLIVSKEREPATSENRMTSETHISITFGFFLIFESIGYADIV